ncbi:Integrase core domain protein [compost metagenome]
MNSNNEFSPIVGEHYSYHGHAYEIVEIIADRYQLRSLERCGTITFQSFDRLERHWRKGRFIRIQEAPLQGAPNKIVAGLSQCDRAMFERRQAYVQAVIEEQNGPFPIRETKRIIACTAQNINDLRPPCFNTVHNWIKGYFRSNQNPISLVTRSIRRKIPRALRQPFAIQEIIQKQLDQYLLIKTPYSGTDIIDQIHAAIAAANARRPVNDPLPSPSASTLRRILKEHDNYERLCKQRGHKEAGKKHHWGRKNSKHQTLLECAECDSHKLDIILVDALGEPCGRPWLTCLINVPSRRVIGWKLSMSPPSLENTLSALKNSLNTGYPRTGLCRTYIVDNGPEFIKEILRVILATMGSTPIFCEPGEPNQKPHIERFFKTLEIQLIHHMRGTTFSNPRQKGDYDSVAQACYTLAQIEDAFQDWLENVYHQAYHRDIGTSPNIYWDGHIDSLFPPRQFSDQTLQQLFLCKESAFAVNGRIGFNKLQWTCPSVPFLNEWRGHRKEITIYYDVCDLGRAFICHPDNPDDLYTVFAADPDYQNGLSLTTHLQILEKIKEEKLKFNHATALNHRLRINQNIAKNNKRKPSRGKSAANERPAREKSGSNHGQDGLSDPSNWMPDEDLPSLTATCPLPPSRNSGGNSNEQ